MSTPRTVTISRPDLEAAAAAGLLAPSAADAHAFWLVRPEA